MVCCVRVRCNCVGLRLCALALLGVRVVWCCVRFDCCCGLCVV